MSQSTPKKESALGLDTLIEDEGDHDVDLSIFKVEPKSIADVSPKHEIEVLANEEGFVKRAGDISPLATNTKSKTANTYRKESKRPAGTMRRSRFYETGRNVQFNKKVEQADRDRFNEICEKQDWVGGQAMKYLLDAIEEKISDPADPFWETRRFRGVD